MAATPGCLCNRSNVAGCHKVRWALTHSSLTLCDGGPYRCGWLACNRSQIAPDCSPGEPLHACRQDGPRQRGSESSVNRAVDGPNTPGFPWKSTSSPPHRRQLKYAFWCPLFIVHWRRHRNRTLSGTGAPLSQLTSGVRKRLHRRSRYGSSAGRSTNS